MLFYLQLQTLRDQPIRAAYLGKVCSVSNPVHHLLTLRVHRSHMGPHPLPGDTLNGKTGPVNVEKNPSIFLLFLPRGVGTVVWGRSRRLLLGAAAEEAVWAGALGPAIPAQLGRGGAGSTWRVGSGHWSQEGQEEEEEKSGQEILFQLQELPLVSQRWTVHVHLQGQTWQGQRNIKPHPYQNTFCKLKSGLNCREMSNCFS